MCQKANGLISFFFIDAYLIVLCLNFHRRSDGRAIRRIRFMQRSVSSSNIVPATKVMIPQEIDMLNKSQLSFVIIGIEFAQASDKDGALLARFDVKCDRSTTSVDINPPLAELIVRNKLDIVEFDKAMGKLHGIHQRTESRFDIPPSVFDKLPSKILKASNLVSISKSFVFFVRVLLLSNDLCYALTGTSW